MKNKKSIYKKILSGMITASIAMSTAVNCTWVSAADFDWSLDFESGLSWDGGYFSFNSSYNSSIFNLEDGEHNNVIKMPAENKGTGTLGSFYFNNTIQEKSYVLSFDFCAMQENVRYVTQWQTTDKKVITCFTVNNNGVAGFAKNGGWAVDPPAGITQYYGGLEYEAGKWYTVDMVVNLDTNTRYYYIDGVYVGECTDTNFGNGIVGNIAILHGKPYVSGTVDSENQALYFDNFSVKYTDTNSFTKEISTQGKEMRIDFTETVVSDLSGIKVYNCATGEEILGTAEQNGKTLKFVAEEDFSDSQYAVQIPGGEIESVTGNTISDEYMYFYADEKSEPYVENVTIIDVYGKEYKPLACMPITQTEIVIDVKGDITAESEEILSKVSLMTESGEECGISNPEFKDGKINLTIDGFLKMSEKYVLTVDGLFGMPTYKAVFNTNDEAVEGFFRVEPVFEDGSMVETVNQGEIFAKTDIINTTASKIDATIGIAAYQNIDGSLKMTALKTENVEAESMKLLSVAPGSVEVKLTVPENTDIIKTFIWQKADAYIPTAESVVIGSYDKKTPLTEDGIFENLDGTVDIASDIGGELVSVIVTSKDNEIVYADQMENAEKTALTVDMAGNTSEEYIITVANNEGDVRTYNLAYINAEEFTSENGVASIIDEALTLGEDAGSEKISETVENNYKLFGINEELFASADMDTVGNILYNKLKDEELSMEDLGWKNASVVANKVFLIAALANGGLENVFDYKEELELEADENWEWYEKEYVTGSVRENITKRLEGEYEKESEFYERLLEAYVLSVVKDSDGEDNLKDVLKNFCEEIGIDKNGKDKTYRKLMGKNFDSYEELKKEFEELENERETSGSSGGSGGSGSKGNKTGSSVTYPVSMNENIATNPIRYEIFKDLENYKWAEQAIVYLAEKRIVTGKGEESFCPADLVTREEFAAMLVRAFAENAEAADISFTDAENGAWYGEYLKKAVGAGIIKGYDDGNFGVGEFITRQDMVVMLNRTAKFAGIVFDSEAVEKFADDADIADYAKEAVYLLKEAGIVNGVNESEFSPKTNANRAQAAKTIFELLNV